MKADQQQQTLNNKTAGQSQIEGESAVTATSAEKITRIYEGTNQAQRIVMARQLRKSLG